MAAAAQAVCAHIRGADVAAGTARRVSGSSVCGVVAAVVVVALAVHVIHRGAVLLIIRIHIAGSGKILVSLIAPTLTERAHAFKIVPLGGAVALGSAVENLLGFLYHIALDVNAHTVKLR